ncbi:MAG TPA: RDD family protein [Rubricoccaceae bacterium]|nr:RDD family protein [Rubricoccaceae bacterium]
MDSFRVLTAQNVDLAFTTASVGDRLLAWFLDAVIGFAYWYLVIALVFPRTYSVALEVVLFLVPLFYHLGFEVFFEGRSPGKMALRLKVARLDGAEPTLGQYLLRWILRPIDIWITSGVVAVVAVAATKHAQRLGDLAAGTTVIRLRRRVSLAEIVYAKPGPAYVLAFPEAERLSDADVRTLRAVLVKLRIEKRSKATDHLVRRAKAAVEQRLGLEPVRMAPEEFLRTVVMDYTAAHDRYGA